ncbi:MAG: ABC transporter permease [Lachnospiraceae bacterium]|nr:ABC transporter permease [Lachnospiraceae bacterium]MDY4068783.1 ABC transporter permease [Lachnospiraceae bacterium]
MSQIFEYIKIALMNIKGNKGRSILTMLGIIIGISSVIMLIAIGNGVKSQINTELDNMAGGVVYMEVSQKKGEQDTVSFTEEDFRTIMDKVPHVKGVTPAWNIWGATAEGRKGSFDAVIGAGNEYLVYQTKDPIIKGSYFTKTDYDTGNMVCVLRESAAKQLFGSTDVVGVTMEVSVYNATRDVTIVGIRKDNASKITSALTETGMIEIEMPMTALVEFGYWIGEYDGMYLIADNSTYSSEVAKKAVQLMEAKYGLRGEDLISIQDFNDSMASINSVLNYITVFVAFVAAISLLVGGIGVMNIMLVSVTERTREIGIRKALGARTSSIMLQFLMESAIITMVGGILGIIIGIGSAVCICTVIGFQADINLFVILIATAFSSSVGLFFGIYPARKAAKLSPIEALRHE